MTGNKERRQRNFHFCSIRLLFCQRHHAKSMKHKNLVMFLYSVLVCIKQIKNTPTSILLCVFFIDEDCQVLAIFPMTIATSRYTSKSILTTFLRHEQMSTLQERLVVVLHLQRTTWRSQSGAAGKSVFTGTTELFWNVQLQSSELRHFKSRCSHCTTCRWTLSA